MKGRGPIPSNIMIVGESFGAKEAAEGRPFVGASGFELDRMLGEAGVSRASCYVTNLINERPPRAQAGMGSDMENWVPLKKKHIGPQHSIQLRSKPVTPNIVAGYQSLMEEIDLVKPNVIIGLGNFSLWALTGIQGIQKWRGSELRLDRPGRELQPVVVPTHHPARILREWSLRAEAVHDIRRATKFINTREIEKAAWTFILRPSFDLVVSTLTGLLQKVYKEEIRLLDLDIETRAGHIACLGISWSRLEAICIPFMCVEDPDGYWQEEQEVIIINLLYRLFTAPNCRVRWQNGMYDAQYIYRHWHFTPNHGQDTMISQHVAFAGSRKALDYQASLYNKHYVYWKDDGKEWDKRLGEDQLWAYNCEDCVRTRECGEVEVDIIDALGLRAQHEFHQNLFNAVLAAVKRGIRISMEARSQFDAELGAEMARREDYFRALLGHPLNPQSPKQMMALFYDDLGMKPILKRRANGTYTRAMDDKSLEELKERDPILRPLFRAIQEHRSLRVFRSSFVGAALDRDGRMRCDLKITGTESYRFSSTKNVFGSGNNMQNIPKGGEDDDSDLKLPNVRSMYIPDEGYECFDLDLSKADLRIVTWEGDVQEMKAMLAEGRDPYVETAREFYRDPTISKLLPSGEEHPKYRIFKSFAHGTHYLGTARGLARKLNLTIHETERTQAWYFGKYPGIRSWQKRVVEQVSKEHQVSNIWGYRRHYFDRVDEDLFRQAIAWIPQSTIAILIDKIWMNLYDNARDTIEVLLQVHDSLFGQYPVNLRERALTSLRDSGRVIIPYSDQLVIPVGIKTSTKSWGDCK